jgi:Xaa-Pro aminopeptidase
MDRIKQLQELLSKPILISSKENLLYLTGYSIKDGFLLVFPQARRKPAVFLGFGLEQFKGLRSDSFKNIGKYLKKNEILNVEYGLTIGEQALFKRLLKGVKIQPVSSPVQQIRLIKSPDELDRLREVHVITAAVFANIKKKLKSEQWTEIGLARYMRIWGLELGADDVSFEPIVAAGSNAAIPHHHPTERVIKSGEPIVLDFGFKLDGYCSDFTRTVFLGRAPKQWQTIYNQVQRSYQAAVAAVRPDMTGEELDGTARKVLRQGKLEKYFIHALGHGTGLEVHELPRISQRANEVLQNGMVFSIEPGVYLPKQGGVRIEDLVYLDNNQANYFVEVSTKLTDNIIK